MQRLQRSLRDYILQRSGGQTVAERQQTGGAAGAGMVPGGTPALIPQFGESFLDRLIELSTLNDDIEYRQGLTNRIIEESLEVAKLDRELSYYEDLNSALGGRVGVDSGSGRAAVETVSRRIDTAVTEVLTAVDDVNAIYEEVSRRNLNPSTLLYTTTRPFAVSSVPPIGVQTTLLLLVVAFLFAVVVVPIVCLFHHYFLREVIGRIRVRPVTRA